MRLRRPQGVPPQEQAHPGPPEAEAPGHLKRRENYRHHGQISQAARFLSHPQERKRKGQQKVENDRGPEQEPKQAPDDAQQQAPEKLSYERGRYQVPPPGRARMLSNSVHLPVTVAKVLAPEGSQRIAGEIGDPNVGSEQYPTPYASS